MGVQQSFLSYGTRREVPAQIAPHYQEASEAQKTLMLDQVVKQTGCVRKCAIQLLNHVPNMPRVSCARFIPSMDQGCRKRSSWLGARSSILVRSA